MRILLIGGTGIISAAVTRRLLTEGGHQVHLLHRGHAGAGESGASVPDGAVWIQADIRDEADVAAKLGDLQFDAVADFIAFEPAHLERDYRLFRGRTRQFVFISSASVYQKPPSDYRIGESTPLANPHWAYARNKIACETMLMDLYREHGFPVTIVRPSHTYDERYLPLAVHGRNGPWQVIRRMLDGKPVIVHGDGTSLWTLTHNSDFAKGFVGLLGNPHAMGETVHITSDETLSWNAIHTIIAQKLGVPFKPCHVPSDFLAHVSDLDFEGSLLGDKAHSVVFDNRKLKRLVPGFVATKRFDEGVGQTLQYVMTHPECQVPDEDFDRWSDEVVAALEAARSSLAHWRQSE